MNLAKLFSLEGKVALVTGGSRGIGYMIAEGLIAAGVRVYICARKAAEVSAAVERLGGAPNCHGLVADLSDEAEIIRLSETIGARESALHLLVNNAGATWGAPLDSYPLDRFNKVLNVNISAPFALTQRFLPLLRAAASEADPARIINIASLDALAPPHWESYAYGASKAGVAMLTRHLAGRLAREHITVNAICPGLFPSKMTAFVFEQDEDPTATYDIPLRRAGNTEDIAGAVIYLASRAGAFVTGISLPVGGGSAVTHTVESAS
jgi:NAD(P)-dependent dehydrogenase (short-subunit alcohol dehydrogenase family)